MLLYPHTANASIVGNYNFISSAGEKRQLNIRTVDLMKVLDWKRFLKEFEKIFD